MSMKTVSRLIGAATLALAAGFAQAGEINDTGTNAYWGGNGHNYGDVIGTSLYDIQGAKITRTGSVLTIVISTNFAGHAGTDASTTTNGKGIGYGDVFLANTWTPAGTDAHHTNDANSTDWDYGFALDNRYSSTGGTFSLMTLAGSNTKDTLLSNSFMGNCKTSAGCYYRDGQAVAVNTNSGTVSKTTSTVTNKAMTGTWTVNKDDSLTFKIDLSGSELLNWTSFAMHWGETCQNDVIEGMTSVTVPLPNTAALFLLGLGSLAMLRRRRRG
jgi:MYXO-CTERM domain-containing protein